MECSFIAVAPTVPCDVVEVSVANNGRELTSCQTRPLCRHYMLCIIDTAIVRLHHADQVSDRSVHWAIGCLLDGECETLGVWLDPAIDRDDSPRIAADLQFRGVERIWHVTGGAADPVLKRLTEVFCSTAVFSCGDPGRPNVPVSPRRREASPAELGAEQARAYLVRAIESHGSFQGEAAVLDFVSGALQQMERRSDRESAAKGRPPAEIGCANGPARVLKNAMACAAWGKNED